MSSRQYSEFSRSLFYALDREGDVHADVSIQGSSIRFFSNPRKTMPYSREAAYDAYASSRGTTPSNYDLDQIIETLTTQWPDPENRPLNRPFDAMLRAHLDPFPSDVDVQISSTHLVDRVRVAVRRLGIDPTSIRVNDPNYDFVRKRLVDEHLLYLSAWIARVSNLVTRPVSVALFGDGGPLETKEAASAPGFSSHFKPDDWVLLAPSEDTA
jgi:hypothetical protein